ncbi:MAG: hypothetical protein ACR2OD_10550 [Gaiellaceae bacterium]
MTDEPPTQQMDPLERARLERYFLHNGLPHLSAGYDPRADTLTRMRPALYVLFVGGLAVALRPDWAWWLRILAVLAGLAVAVGIYASLNLLRERPLFARSKRIGLTETLALVIAPPIAALALGEGGGTVALLAVATIGIALALYFLMSFGVLSLLAHQTQQIKTGLADSGAIAIRAMPPVLAVLLFLSLSTETWQAFGGLIGWRYGGVVIAFAILIVLILVYGLSQERAAVHSIEPGEKLEERARRTPALALVERGVVPSAPRMGPIERLNIGLALVLSLALRVFGIALAVGFFFLVFSFLVVDRDLALRWVDADPNFLVSAVIADREVVLTEAHFRVAGILGAFGALYFTAVAIGDARHRERFLDDELDRLSRVTAAWAYYRGALRR